MIAILAGEKRGAKLTPCDSPSVRPTAQRTREALFNILNGGRIKCTLSGAHIIDVFAGSGALGFEALSRGAAHVVFIEKDPSAMRVIKRNGEKLGYLDQIDILNADACQITHWPYDKAGIIFCDAPYDSALSQPALTALSQNSAVEKDAVISVETRRKEQLELDPAFHLLDSRHYGIAQLNFFTYQP
jgi:16S rRNA (guanine966-N2)-methyltransferase